jgi:hypothetical protein
LSVFVITTLLLGIPFLAIVGLLHVAKDLWARPLSPVPSYSETLKALDDKLPEEGQPARAASRDIPLEREYT